MKQLISLSAVALAAFCCVARAAGYDDFSRGIAANGRDDSDAAIAAFTKALNDGDLNPTLEPVAYLGRAKAYLRQSNCPKALADLNSAIDKRPNDGDALRLRASAHLCTGALAQAENDMSAALAIAPSAEIFFSRGEMRWASGRFQQAADDFEQATKLEPSHPYNALWWAISQRRAGTFETKKFESELPDFSSHRWPGPILNYFLGNRTSEEVYAAAIDGEADQKRDQACEADFYVGEWELTDSQSVAALNALKSAAAACPHNFIEFSAAQAELKRPPAQATAGGM